MKWVSLLKDIKDKVGFSVPTSAASSSSPYIDQNSNNVTCSSYDDPLSSYDDPLSSTNQYEVNKPKCLEDVLELENSVNIKDKVGFSAPTSAASSSSPYIDQNSNNATCSSYDDPLSSTNQYEVNKPKCLEDVLELENSVNIKDKVGFSAPTSAASSSSSYIDQNSNNATCSSYDDPLSSTNQYEVNKPKCLEDVLELENSVNIKDKVGFSAPTSAASSSSPYIDQNSNNATCSSYDDPLSSTNQYEVNKPKCLEDVLELENSVNIKDKVGFSAPTSAASSSSSYIDQNSNNATCSSYDDPLSRSVFFLFHIPSFQLLGTFVWKIMPVDHVGFSAPTSAASSSSPYIDQNSNNATCSSYDDPLSREIHELELDFKRSWDEFRTSNSEMEKEKALNVTIDVFCRLVNQYPYVAQLNTLGQMWQAEVARNLLVLLEELCYFVHLDSQAKQMMRWHH
ncbi:hypothetical protein L2E82_13097 [Cichorium intybus]|uniref:Uncharacterized protein n=1 Tax=Cichorium intybus TaxID=13427 RepID=A0ACB9GJ38_CICIN|nr:hypothetical protein L2E82_13097 [Cichorium intybus]